jgi:peptidoglycan/LPS O-acetylase OafA/YrhL
MAEPVPRARPGFFGLELLDNRYPVLHGLRVFAILSVVQYHVTWVLAGEQHVELHEGFRDASLSIFFGMDLFFVLSGFLIGSILLRSLEVSGSQDIRRFYIRRIFRTFPSYWLVLTILALALPLTDAQLRHLPYEYVYLTNFMPLLRPEIVMFWGWSLALEEQFYLTVPILFFVLWRIRDDRARIALLAALWAVPLALRLYLFYRYAPWNDYRLYDTLYFRTPTRFDTIVAGILLAYVHQRWGDRIGEWLRHPFHRALLALPSLALLWVLLRPNMFGDDWLQTVRVLAWGTLTSLMYFPALLLFLHGDGWLHRFFGAPIFRQLATLGYGVYLVHIPMIDHVFVPLSRELEAQGHSLVLVWIAAFALVTASSFAIGYVLHVLVEKPSLRLREKLAA